MGLTHCNSTVIVSPPTVLAQRIEAFGEIAHFCGRVLAGVFSGRVFRFTAETLRQAGILILGSGIVLWGLAFLFGLTCGIEGAYFSRSTGAPAYAGSSPPGATCARLCPTRSAT
jgi:ABC-type transporter Mla maintaining outer membrane lipid asymmetry permease subunit MlaE